MRLEEEQPAPSWLAARPAPTLTPRGLLPTGRQLSGQQQRSRTPHRGAPTAPGEGRGPGHPLPPAQHPLSLRHLPQLRRAGLPIPTTQVSLRLGARTGTWDWACSLESVHTGGL